MEVSVILPLPRERVGVRVNSQHCHAELDSVSVSIATNQTIQRASSQFSESQDIPTSSRILNRVQDDSGMSSVSDGKYSGCLGCLSLVNPKQLDTLPDRSMSSATSVTRSCSA